MGGGNVEQEGWNASTGYKLPDIHIESNPVNVNLVARFERFNPNKRNRNNRIQGSSIGMNVHLPQQYFKFQLSYTHFDMKGQKNENRLITAFQTAL